MAKKRKKFTMAQPVSHHHSMSVSARPISNGFISSVSHSGPDGYKDTEKYHRTDPMKHKGGSIASMLKKLKMLQTLRAK